MSCTCISYNQPNETQTTPERVLPIPDWAKNFGESRATVCVDDCIADAVLSLWDAKIWTLGSCCGHGVIEKRSVIVDVADRQAAIEILSDIDSTIRVGAWELVWGQPVTALQAEVDRLREALRDIAEPKVGPDVDWSKEEANAWRAGRWRWSQNRARAALNGDDT